MTKSIKFIDLFAGVGGFRIAFESQKAQCVFSSEWDKFSQITYEANFGEKPEGDITLIDSKKIPNHEILTAGFPCQPFSNAGLKKGFEDTRGTLFYDVARIINDKKPSMVLLENVKGFVNHNKGRTLRVVLETLDDITQITKY
jgi:DNA (cytosine-5)-methyltransferase 1